MKARCRAWLVTLIADGIKQANRAQPVEVQIDGKQVITTLNKYNRRRGIS